MVLAISRFNETLLEQRPSNPKGVWELDPSVDELSKNYFLYQADEDGEIEDEISK